MSVENSLMMHKFRKLLLFGVAAAVCCKYCGLRRRKKILFLPNLNLLQWTFWATLFYTGTFKRRKMVCCTSLYLSKWRKKFANWTAEPKPQLFFSSYFAFRLSCFFCFLHHLLLDYFIHNL